ncbi:MAG TPA: MMPL family transporter [Thermoanaerobaculia bacterium]|nr:MMPL family transporter [Thermoanaerobaculia bacterium]
MGLSASARRLGDARRLHWGARLGWASAARPRTALAVMLTLVLAMVPGLFRLELRTDGYALVPPDDPAIAADRAARRLFGLRDPLLVVLETTHPDGIFNAGTLDRLQRVTRDVAALPGIGADAVQSLATEPGGSFYPGTSRFRPMLDPPPRTREQLAEVRGDVEAIDLLHGTLVSFDSRAAALLVGVPGPADRRRGEIVDRAALYHRVAATVRRYETATDRVSVVGAPAAEALLGEHVLADLSLLVPLALAVIAAILWAACGRAWGVFLGLAKVGAAQVFTFGLIGWCGQPVYLTTAMIPVLLTTVGLSDEIHLLWRYRHRPAGQPPAEALHQTLGELGRPIVLTSLTTAIGFLSFLTSPIRPVWSFGLFTGIGVLFCLVWAVVATPALLALRPAAVQAVGSSGATSRLARLAIVLGARPRLVLPILALGTAVLALGLSRLEVQDGWITNFAPHSPLRLASERVDRRFAGTHVLQAVVTFDPPPEEVPEIPAARGPLLAGSAVAAVGRFEQALRARPEVGGVFGLSGTLSTTAFLWGGRNEEFREIGDDPAWIYLYVRRIANVRGEARRRELIDDGFHSTVVTLLLKAANFRETARLMAAIRELERRELAPVHGRVDFAGDVAVSQAMIPAIVRSQLGSLLLAVAGNLLIVALLFRSLRAGLVCIAPSAVAVAWTFGIMGWLGVPLGVATSMFCAVTLGIGIDYSIHFFERFQEAESAGFPRPGLAASAAAGPSILIDSLAISLGFGLLVFSRVPTNRWLGLLVALALSSACLLTLTSSGALLAALSRRWASVRRQLALVTEESE